MMLLMWDGDPQCPLYACLHGYFHMFYVSNYIKEANGKNEISYYI